MELQPPIFDQPSFANAGGDVLRSENLLSVPSLETALPTESVEPPPCLSDLLRDHEVARVCGSTLGDLILELAIGPKRKVIPSTEPLSAATMKSTPWLT